MPRLGGPGSVTTNTVLPGFTEGSVLFVDSVPSLAEDNANFFWDDTNNRLGIGTSSPDGILHLDNGTSDTDLILEKDADTSADIIFHNAGAAAAHIAFDSNEDIVIENDTADKDIIFKVLDGAADTEVMRIQGSTSRIGIGRTDPLGQLSISTTGAATVGFAIAGASAQTGSLLILTDSNDAVFMTSGSGLTGSSVIWNDQAADIDFRIESVNSQTMFFLDAGNNIVKLGHDSTQGRLGEVLELTRAGNASNFGGISLTTFAATAAATAPVIDFQRSDSATVDTHALVDDGDALGYIGFRGSDGSAFRTAGQIQCEVDGTSGASDMPGRLVFSTTPDGGTSATEAMRINSSQNVGIGVIPNEKLQVDDAIAVSNDTEGSTARATIRTTHETHTLTLGATSDTTTISIPSGAIIIGASFNVNTAVTDDAGDDTWNAAFITGSTTTLATNAAAAQDTKVDTMVVPEIASAVTEIRFTPNGGNFTAGVIEIVAYYWELTSLANV